MTTTATLDALLAAVIADPDDDLPRMALADLLEERGGPGDDARAEFIRVQMELNRPGGLENCGAESCYYEPRCAYHRLLDRERELWETRDGDGRWIVGDTPLVDIWYSVLIPQNNLCSSDSAPMMIWRRGFPDEFRCTAESWKAHGPRLVREHPIRVVRLTGRTPAGWTRDAHVWWIDDAHPEQWFRVPTWLGMPSRPAAQVPGARHSDVFPTAEAALAALSARCIAWAKTAPAF